MNGYAYDESSRRRWVLIAGAALAAVAMLAVGFGIGRASAPSASGRAQVVNIQSGPGPTHVVNGVPVGYAHTQAGAVAAATNYLMVISGPLITQPDKYRTAIDTLASPTARDKLRRVAEANMTGQQNLISYASQGRTVVLRLVPLAFKVNSYGDNTAQMSIWAESLVAVDGVLSLREGWTTTAVTSEWTAGDWKLSDIGAAGPDSFGPAPTPVQAPAQSVALPPQLTDYRGYRADAT